MGNEDKFRKKNIRSSGAPDSRTIVTVAEGVTLIATGDPKGGDY